ncbi:hypothetical protein ABIC76_004693 [Ralstonia sp. 1138]
MQKTKLLMSLMLAVSALAPLASHAQERDHRWDRDRHEHNVSIWTVEPIARWLTGGTAVSAFHPNTVIANTSSTTGASIVFHPRRAVTTGSV